MNRLTFGDWRVLTFLSVVSLLGPNAAAQHGRACDEWLASVKSYDQAFEEVMRGEPEEQLSVLEKACKAEQEGDAQSAKSLERSIHGKAAALREIDAPADVVDQHRKLIRYIEAVEASFRAILGEGTCVRSRHLRPCYQALIDYYEALRQVFIVHECQDGDLEALETRILPRLRGILRVDSQEDEAPGKSTPAGAGT